MTAQKALFVVVDPAGPRADALDVLNEHLRAGWVVTLATPMGGGGATPGFASLVVIEQRGAAAESILGQIEEAMDQPTSESVQDPLLRRLQGDADDLGPLENRG
jgi:hypothetical protein